jgi:hypothetical protein
MRGPENRKKGQECTRLVIMPGAEARDRGPKYKEYKRLRDAENFARNQLSIRDVDYGGRLDIANVSNHALLLAYLRRIPMPCAIRVRAFSEDEDTPEELAYYDAGLLDRPGEIVVNSAHPAWSNLEEIMAQAGIKMLLSTSDSRHPIIHEMGELAMHQSIGGDRFFPFGESYLADERAFRDLVTTGRLPIARIVSRRAGLNHSEFVAEVFSGLVLGRNELRDNLMVMAAYRRFGGEQLSRWTE